MPYGFSDQRRRVLMPNSLLYGRTPDNTSSAALCGTAEAVHGEKYNRWGEQATEHPNRAGECRASRQERRTGSRPRRSVPKDSRNCRSAAKAAIRRITELPLASGLRGVGEHEKLVANVLEA
jgi:hypothetical protein